jgi:hypothetical protein
MSVSILHLTVSPQYYTAKVPDTLQEASRRKDGRTHHCRELGKYSKKHSRIQHQIAPSSKRTQTDKQTEDFPVRRCACNNRKHAAHQQTDIEGDLAAHDIRRHAPEQRAHQHAHVHCNRQPIGIPRRELERRGRRDDGLNQQDERVDGVAEAVEDEEFPVVWRPANLVALARLARVVVEGRSTGRTWRY